MISEWFLNIIFSLVEGMFSALPDISWSVDTSSFDAFFGLIKFVGYLLPWVTVVRICALIIALSIFRIFVAIVKTIWDLLPLV